MCVSGGLGIRPCAFLVVQAEASVEVTTTCLNRHVVQLTASPHAIDLQLYMNCRIGLVPVRSMPAACTQSVLV